MESSLRLVPSDKPGRSLQFALYLPLWVQTYRPAVAFLCSLHVTPCSRVGFLWLLWLPPTGQIVLKGYLSLCVNFVSHWNDLRPHHQM